MFKFISQSDYDVVALVETWLNPNFFDAELCNLQQYRVFRKDRDEAVTHKTRGGGVLIAVKKCYDASRIMLCDNNPLLDQICVCINGAQKMYLCLSYIPPNSDDILYKFHVDNIINLASEINQDCICVLGDFNLKDVVWSDLFNTGSLIPSNVNHPYEINLIDSFLSIGLVQVNAFKNKLNRTLDLVFLSDSLKFKVFDCQFPLCAPDMHHVPLILNLSYYNYMLIENSVNIIYNFKACDYVSFCLELAYIDWNSYFCNKSLVDCYNDFCDILCDKIKKFVPRVSKKIHKLPWYTKGLKILKNQRNKYYNKFRATGNNDFRLKYEHFMREFNFLDKFLYKQYLLNYENLIKSDPKNFWSFIRSKKCNSAYPSSMFLYDTVANSGNEIANLFALFFKSNFESNSNINVHSDTLKFVEPIVDFGALSVSEQDVYNAVLSINSSYGTDSDGLSAHLIKQCVSCLCQPLTLIFNKSLSSGCFLGRWKVCHITPILKSGDKSNICNYRPISKLSVVAKIFEHVIKEKIFFNVKRHICVEQHGFFSGRSTTTNLTVFNHFCISAFEKHHNVDVVFADLCKAFDKVSHKILYLKLKKMGFYGNILEWIESYLSNRTYTVIIDKFQSQSYVATSGVPQGSVLGPLLFLLFINDISYCVRSSNCLLYADDLKIFKEICNVSHEDELQSDLNNIYIWCNNNQLPLNLNKCFQMTFSRSRSHIRSSRSYAISNVVLKSVSEILDLGVVLDPELRFESHINYVVSKAYSVWAFVKRNCKGFTDPYTVKLLYTSFVRSKLEYCSFVWSPFYAVHTNRIEKLQKTFLRYALRDIFINQSVPSYYVRCLLLGLKPLYIRRKVQSIMIIFNIINSNIDCEYLFHLISFCVPSYFLRYNNVFFVNMHLTNYASNEPITRALNLLNKINCKFELDFSISTDKFKNNLENKILLNILLD